MKECPLLQLVLHSVCLHFTHVTVVLPQTLDDAIDTLHTIVDENRPHAQILNIDILFKRRDLTISVNSVILKNFSVSMPHGCLHLA